MATTNSDTTTVAASAPAGARIVERTRSDDVAATPSALRSERIKILSLRSNLTILALTPVIGFVLSWIMATFVKVDPDTGLAFTVSVTFIFSTWLTATLTMVIGALAFTSEAQHGTLATAISAQPARWVTVAAKTVVVAGFGTTMGILGMVGGLGGAVVGGLPAGDTSAMASTALWGLALTTLAPILGLGVGMVLRHSAAAVSILLVWAFVVENIVRALIPVSAARYLPFSAANNMLGIASSTDTPESIAAALTSFQNAVLFGSYASAFLAAGIVLLYRRDVN